MRTNVSKVSVLHEKSTKVISNSDKNQKKPIMITFKKVDSEIK
jgi:hypothetical protein